MTHPITPPPELVQQWINEEPGVFAEHIANRAAQWGADIELKACCKWLEAYDYDEVGRQLAEVMHATRRSKPPSLKEQALKELQMAYDTSDISMVHLNTIRRALEQLPDNE